ncbi:HGGxSTG domain-containing protein [Tardiphaga sp. 20_F10_N6_6]|uniref:HGGxSTG domain-containing protein n=1 Tax=Tardiphaga sp. 20_F10_N6_6 TaxID=3240788 RepID=UPI003F897559
MDGTCGAKNRGGLPCRRSPAVGKRRCRLHGGAPRSGAPLGEANGNYRHGRYGRAAKELRRKLLAEGIERLRQAEARARAPRALVPNLATTDALARITNEGTKT